MKKYYVKVLSEIGIITLITFATSEEEVKEKIINEYNIQSILEISTELPNKNKTFPIQSLGFYHFTLPKKNNYGINLM